MLTVRVQIVSLALLLASGSCLFVGAHDRCHQRALEQLGCCPFHGEDDCEFGADERIREACAEDLADLFEDETMALTQAESEVSDDGEAPDDGGDETASEPR